VSKLRFFWLLLLTAAPLCAGEGESAQELGRVVIVSHLYSATDVVNETIELITGHTPRMEPDHEFENGRVLCRYLRNTSKYGVPYTLLGGPPGAPRALCEEGFFLIFPLCDPRDLLVVVLNEIEENRCSGRELRRMENRDHRLTELITGARFGCSPIRELAADYYRLKRLPRHCWSTVHIGSLLGVYGSRAQRRAVARVASLLEVELSKERICEIAHTLNHSSRLVTTRELIGRSEEYFQDHHTALVEKFHGRFLRDLEN